MRGDNLQTLHPVLLHVLCEQSWIEGPILINEMERRADRKRRHLVAELDWR